MFCITNWHWSLYHSTIVWGFLCQGLVGVVRHAIQPSGKSASSTIVSSRFKTSPNPTIQASSISAGPPSKNCQLPSSLSCVTWRIGFPSLKIRLRVKTATLGGSAKGQFFNFLLSFTPIPWFGVMGFGWRVDTEVYPYIFFWQPTTEDWQPIIAAPRTNHILASGPG